MNRFSGKVVLISGGGADGPPAPGETLTIGNGRATAILCAREGAAVMVADRSLDSAQQTAAAIEAEGGRAQAIAADVTNEQACQQAVRTTVERFGALHLLVNNVGIVGANEVASDIVEFKRVMDVNVVGHLAMIRHAITEMIKAGGGAIVNVSSIGAIRGAGIGYGASKAALLALTRAVALQHARQGIRANVILPGLINSSMARRLSGDREAKVAPFIPMGRQGTSWEIAKAIVFLLSDEASYITGAELVVDGGLTGCLSGF